MSKKTWGFSFTLKEQHLLLALIVAVLVLSIIGLTGWALAAALLMIHHLPARARAQTTHP